MGKTLFAKNVYAMNELIQASIFKMEKKRALDKTCLKLYNNPCLCLNKSEIIVLASRPSIGKTALAINWGLDFAAHQNTSVGFITSGIPDSEFLILRLLALESKISPVKLRSGFLYENDIEQIEYTVSKLSNLPIFICDRPNINFENIETVATEMVNKNKIKILIIDGFDYIFEIAVSKSICKDAQWAEQMEPYYDEIYCMMENLKTLANNLQIPIVLLAPIKHDAFGNEPTIKTFEDKLIIPRIADKVIFLHRDRNKNDDEWQDAKLIVAKNNNGPCGDVEIKYNFINGEFLYKETTENLV